VALALVFDHVWLGFVYPCFAHYCRRKLRFRSNCPQYFLFLFFASRSGSGSERENERRKTPVAWDYFSVDMGGHRHEA
jgi:hypothetical protein